MPNLKTICAKFDKEHYHTLDEVRFVVDGEGIVESAACAVSEQRGLDAAGSRCCCDGALHMTEIPAGDAPARSPVVTI